MRARFDLLGDASVAIDGSKFKAVNNRDKNFTEAKMKRRLEQIDESIARYLSQLDTADRRGPTVPEAKTTRLKEKIAKLREEIGRLNTLNARMMASEDFGPRCALDGDQWQRQRDGRLQCADRRGYDASSHRCPRGDQRRDGSQPTVEYCRAGTDGDGSRVPRCRS
jgi:hypothetical protein